MGDDDIPKKRIDEAASIALMVNAVKNGINYFDTAYVYQGGQSEIITGKALKPHREKVFIATKLPTMIIRKTSEMEKCLDEQQRRFDTDYLDVYLAHAMNRKLWHHMRDVGMSEFFDRIRTRKSESGSSGVE